MVNRAMVTGLQAVHHLMSLSCDALLNEQTLRAELVRDLNQAFRVEKTNFRHICSHFSLLSPETDMVN